MRPKNREQFRETVAPGGIGSIIEWLGSKPCFQGRDHLWVRDPTNAMPFTDEAELQQRMVELEEQP